jgi:hypothetical protein
MIKSRRVRWVGHVAHTGELENVYKFLSENLKGRLSLEDLDVDWEIIILEWILNRVGVSGLYSCGSELGQVPGSCEHDN